MDPNRDLIRAVDRLTTQVGRIADVLEPPADDGVDGAQATGVISLVPWSGPRYKMCSASMEGYHGRIGPCVLPYLHEAAGHQDSQGHAWV